MVVLPFNTRVELVLQDTSIIGAESHPLHLHGFNFHVVGQGFGNFDPKKDPSNFNLVDPIERNTVGVPSGGWVAIRFRADNPGVYRIQFNIPISNAARSKSDRKLRHLGGSHTIFFFFPCVEQGFGLCTATWKSTPAGG